MKTTIEMPIDDEDGEMPLEVEMKTEPKHTPVPWVVNPPMTARVTFPRMIHAIQFHEVLDERNRICMMTNSRFEDDANAAFIVEACNNYERIKAERDELAAALKTLLIDVQDYPAWKRPCYAVDVARAALAKLDIKEDVTK